MAALAGPLCFLVGFYEVTGKWGGVRNKDCQRMAIPLTLGV